MNPLKGDVFAVLGSPNRRRILELLRSGPLSGVEIFRELGLHATNAYSHMAVLVEAGLLTLEPNRPRACNGEPSKRSRYRLSAAPFAELERWLSTFQPSGPEEQK